MLEYSSKVKKNQKLKIRVGKGLENPVKNNHAQLASTQCF